MVRSIKAAIGLMLVLLLACGCGPQNTEELYVTPDQTDLPGTGTAEEGIPTAEPTEEPEHGEPAVGTIASADRIDMEQLSRIDSSVNGTWSAAWDKNGEPIFNKGLQEILDKYGAAYIGARDQKVLYLTFTAGYEEGCTGKILDVLKKYDIKASFFILQWYAVSAPELTRRIIDEGHDLGNHTLTHKQLPNVSLETVVSEICDMHEYIRENFQYEMLYFRPSYNMFDERAIAAADMAGYKISLWSFAYRDWGDDRGTAFAYESLLNSLHNGCVLNLHATYRSNAEVLERFIQEALSRGYTFAPISQLYS